MTVSPRYDQYKDAWDTSVLVQVRFPILLNSREIVFCLFGTSNSIKVSYVWIVFLKISS